MEQKKALSAIEEKQDLIFKVNDKIWDYAEIGFQEVQSCRLYCDTLKQEGFTVEEGLAGMPTAFKASYGSGKPVIGLLAEYDALPMLGQKSGCAQKVMTENTNGHGCGHNTLGAGVFAAALAVKAHLEEHPGGTVVLFGCPSEERGCGKTFMARDGIFDDVDAAFTWHPSDSNRVWGYSTLANIIIDFAFKGKTAHAAAAPHMGRSALDAAELMNVGSNFLREHIVQEARLHYAFLDVGGDAPNVVQDTSKIKYNIRAPKSVQVAEIAERVKDIARGAALMTGTEATWEVFAGLSDYVPNHVLSEVLQEALEAVGTPNFDEADFALAAEFFHKSYPEEILEANKATVLKTYGAEKGAEVLKKPIDTTIAPLTFPNFALAGSTDVGDTSYVVPTAQLVMATGAIGTQMHTWQMTAQGNTPIAKKAAICVGKTIALAAIAVLENPALAKAAKEELHQTTGGKYLCPIPKEVAPRLKD